MAETALAQRKGPAVPALHRAMDWPHPGSGPRRATGPL